jgi:hypothetical protein
MGQLRADWRDPFKLAISASSLESRVNPGESPTDGTVDSMDGAGVLIGVSNGGIATCVR